jgi:glycosyltransferase involved in cell wall biosynthesis
VSARGLGQIGEDRRHRPTPNGTSGDPSGGGGPTLVVTSGSCSMDSYSQRIGERLGLPTLATTIPSRSSERFGIPALSMASARCLVADLRFLGRLRGEGGPLHFAGQHLARYGPPAGRPYVVTVHDLIRWFDLARREPLIQRPNLRDRLSLRLDYRACRRAAGLIAISRTTRRDLVRHLGVESNRVAVALNGVDHELFRPIERRLFDFPYVLYVGTEQPRKNLEALLRALARLTADGATPDLRLVKVGSCGPRPEDRERTLRVIADLGLEGRVHFTGRLTDEDLVAAYCGAACAAFPSRYEGFCLPVVEAMACGCQVIASTAGALPEVVGDAGLLVDPDDDRLLAAAIEAIVADGAGAALRHRGLRRAASFSWERTAAETMAAYERFLP